MSVTVTKTRQDGFILVLALMVLSIGVLLVTQLFHRGTGHIYFDEAVITSQKAKNLALSSLELIRSQLAVTSTEKLDDVKDRKLLLTVALPYFNRWQTITLTKTVDGIDAQLHIMLNCESGKLNVNKLFDFSKKKFISDDIKSLLQGLFLSMKKFAQDKDLFSVFEKFLKDRKYPLDDISDLLAVDDFKKAFGARKHSFPLKEQESADLRQAPIYLFDIFTVWPDHATVSAWVISDGLGALLGLKRASVGTIAERTKIAKEITKDVDVNDANLTKLWDTTLKKWYGKEYKQLPKGIDKLLDAVFDPIFFGFTCYAKVGSITQKLYAIIEREFDEKRKRAEFRVRKLYWI